MKSREYPVKERIFLAYMAFFTLLSILTLVGNLAAKVDFSFNFKWIGGAFLCGGLGTLAFFRIKPALIHRIGIFLLAFLFIPAGWISSAGIVSPIFGYSFLTLILINYLLKDWERAVADILFIGLNFGLVLLFGRRPDLFLTLTREAQIRDWLINIPLLFGFAALLLGHFETAHSKTMNELQTNAERLKKMAQTDPLTGLHNRHHLDEHWPLVSGAHVRTGKHLAVMMVDIDHFKRYNDTHGHLKGDECLRRVAGILRTSCNRKTDLVYRLGGEEFLLLLSYTDDDGAMRIGREIQKQLRLAAIPQSADTLVTVSMGLATSFETYDLEKLIHIADMGLYQAKGTGRNKICRVTK